MAFPIALQGSIEGVDCTIPFTSTSDAQHYIDQLVWAMGRFQTKIDLKIWHNGVTVGEVTSPDYSKLNH